MTDFGGAREELAAARTQARDADDELARARTRLRTLAAEQARRDASSHRTTPSASGSPSSAAAQRPRRSARQDVRDRAAGRRSARPRSSARTPTRARTSAGSATATRSCCSQCASRRASATGGCSVRVYPDTCTDRHVRVDAVRGRGPQRSQAYWQGIWRAAGVEADERTAWRGLVASHGSGRAAWPSWTTSPANAADRPQKARPRGRRARRSPARRRAAPRRDDLGHVLARASGAADGDLAAERAALQALRDAVGAAARPRARRRPPAVQPRRRAGAAAHADDVASVAWPSVGRRTSRRRTSSWTQAPRVDAAPGPVRARRARPGRDRIESRSARPSRRPLFVGPDPPHPSGEQLRGDGDDLVVPDELRWMIDFDRAVECGLGFSVALTPEQAAAGFDRLHRAGVRLSAEAQEGTRARLEELLRAPPRSRSGLEPDPAGHADEQHRGRRRGLHARDDADASFDDRCTPRAPRGRRRRKRTGSGSRRRWASTPRSWPASPGAGGMRPAEARAHADRAVARDARLLPGDDDGPAFCATRPSRHAPLPPATSAAAARSPRIRIGAQPYGILPTTAFSRIGWIDRRKDGPRFLASPVRRSCARSTPTGPPWPPASPTSATARDPHADACSTSSGCTPRRPSSTTATPRASQHLHNHLTLAGSGPSVVRDVCSASELDAAGARAPRRRSATRASRRQCSSASSGGGQGALLGDVVDDRPLSETSPIRPWTTDGRNLPARGCSTPPARRSTRCACRTASPTTSRPPRCSTSCCATR